MNSYSASVHHNGAHSHLFGLILLLLLLNPFIASARQSLALDEFVQIVLDHNPGVQRILAKDAIAAGDLEASKGIDDPVLGAQGAFNQTEPDRINGFEPDQTQDTRVDLSLDRLNSASGTRIGMSYGNQHTERDPASAALGAKYYQPSLTLRLTQPLLKNAWGIQDRLNLELNQLGLGLSRLQTREELESYITRLAALYLDWYLAWREMNISRDVHNQAVEQEKLVKLKVDRQVAEPYELYRSQETRADYYSRLQQDIGVYNGLSKQIARQMNAELERVTRPSNPKNSALLGSLPENGDYVSSRSRLKAILDTLKAQQDILTRARQNARRPDLNISLAYTRHGADSGFSEAHKESFDSNDYSVILEYEYPLGNRAARGAYHSQIASRRQIEADTAQQMIDALASLDDLRSQHKQLEISLRAADRKIALADKKLKEENHLFEIGDLDLFELIQDQTSQLESRLSRERIYTQMQQIRLSIGELLDQNLDDVRLVPFHTNSGSHP